MNIMALVTKTVYYENLPMATNIGHSHAHKLHNIVCETHMFSICTHWKHLILKPARMAF